MGLVVGLVGQCFIFCALFSSKSGLVHKHTVKHAVTNIS